jgi:hypothetical protein
MCLADYREHLVMILINYLLLYYDSTKSFIHNNL